MAHISLSIRRDNGVTVNADGDVPDALVADIAMTLGAILFDASAESAQPEPAPTPEPTPEPTPAPEPAPVRAVAVLPPSGGDEAVAPIPPAPGQRR